MKLVNMICPQCGAKLEIDRKSNSAICQFCGAKLLIDDEVQHMQYDNAEETGYNFEKGRQRAKMEASLNTLHSASLCPKCDSSNITFTRESAGTRGYHKTTALCKNCGNTWTVTTDISKAKNRRTWLWVLGWLIIFPVPLTILMLRNKKLDKRVRIGIIIIAWIAYLIIGIAGNSNGTIDHTTTTVTSEQFEVTDDSSNEMLGSDEAKNDTYADDERINRFITEYNASSKYQMTDISRGNIVVKYFGHSNNSYVEMLDAYTGIFEINVRGGTTDGGSKETVLQAIDVFVEIVKVLDPTLSEEQINKVADSMRSGNYASDDLLLNDNVSVNYYPKVFGDYDCRIEISAPNY